MSVIVTFTVPGGDVALGRALSPTMRAELDRVVPVGDATIPYVWLTASDEETYAEFEKQITADPAIDSIRLLDRFGDRRLYRFRWIPGQSPVFDRLEASEAALLDASGDHESWTFKLRFPDQEALSEFYQDTVDSDLDIEITGVSDFVLDDTEHGLSEQQRDTLLRALESGFYNIPRDTTTVDFAGELGISDQSLSERLRRAHATLIENALR